MQFYLSCCHLIDRENYSEAKNKNTPNMQCCVPFCVNTTDNASTSEKTEITFHELPSEEKLCAAWLKALGTLDQPLPDPAVVCSQHFLDEDFYKAEDCVKQIRSDAIPSTLQMCMMCLDTDSKLLLMSKHKLEEMYEQLTGLSLFQLCSGANLRPTLCVLCAQRLINFRRFRELGLRAYSLLMELLEKHGLITILHKKLMNITTKHLKCNLTKTKSGADCWDSYIDHTEEEQQTAAEEAAVGDVTVVVKTEDISDSMLSTTKMELDSEDDNALDNINNDCVPGDEYSDLSIKLESELEEPIPAASCAAAAQHVVKTESFIKVESVNFQCTVCYEDIADDNYNEHMSMHLQNAGGDAACGAAVSCSWDPLMLDKMGGQRLNDDSSPAATAQALDPLSARLAANKDNKVRATVETGAIQKSEQILETNISKLGNKLFQRGIKPHTASKCRKRTRTGGKPYTCEICNFKTAKQTYLISHMIKHSDEKPYSCEMCDYACARKSQLTSHRRIHTGEKPYTCDLCHYKSAHKGSLINHMSIHTGEKPYSCDLCNYKSADKSHLLCHLRIHTGERPYSCDKCKFKCSFKHILIKHKRIHTGEKPYSCDLCPYKAAQSRSLLIHMKTHTGEKPFCCEICNHKFLQKSHLNMHRKTHTGEKPYSCEICNHKCARKTDLIQHKRIHTGEKPYSCDICNCKYARNENLKKHKRIHSGEKPYSCDICDFRCAQKSDLIKHNSTHGDKPYSCAICNYKTLQKSDLVKHKRTHTGEKPYSCDICSYKCAETSNLYRHMRIHTPLYIKSNCDKIV